MTKNLKTPSGRWYVLAGLFLIYMASNGIALHTLPILYPVLMDNFGWSAAEVTLPATVFFVVGALTSLPAGWLLDRYSPRAIILIGVVGLTLCLFAYASVTQLWQLLLIYAGLGTALSMCGLVSNMVILGHWFDALRGRAAGILLMASSLGGALFPLLVGKGLLEWGWRDTLLAVAGCTGLVMFLATIILIRSRPSAGAQPEQAGAGDEKNDEPPPSESQPALLFPELKLAVQSRNFYLIAFATAALWFVIISLVQHQSIYLAKDMALPRSTLPLIFSAFFGCSVIGKLGFGFLSDRFNKRYVMMGSVVCLAFGLLLLRFIDVNNTTMLFSYAVIAGIGFSGAFTCIQLLIADHYMGPAYGRMLAIMVLMDTLAGALGNRLTGLIREAQGSYGPALDGLVILCVLSVVAIASLRPTVAKGVDE